MQSLSQLIFGLVTQHALSLKQEIEGISNPKTQFIDFMYLVTPISHIFSSENFFFIPNVTPS